ncbi:hypothetical protein HanPSC8_Chr04g0143341 [Helianthus annuus]|nr:hypothetical protein HanPSC8_Chr04g0143341 [Helianthus annuus]
MGNCQAIDNASLIIQHPTGKVEKLYSAISAAEVMKLNPGHYVALLLTTTLYSSTTKRSDSGDVSTNPQPLRVTRIKLLRHTDSLMVGHVYRLVTTQEVMKGLMAKKNGKIGNNNIRQPKPSEQPASKHEPASVRSNQSERTHHQMKRSERDNRKTTVPVNSSTGTTKPRGWHPSLNSISEASN